MKKLLKFLFASFGKATRAKLAYPFFRKQAKQVENYFFLYLICSSYLMRLVNRAFINRIKDQGICLTAKHLNGLEISYPFFSYLDNYEDLFRLYLDEYLTEFEEVYGYRIEVEAGDTVVDIGAHIGTFCVPLAFLHDANVIAIEPSKYNFKTLLSNINNNNLEGKVIPVNGAIFDRSSSLDFVEGDATTRGSIKDANFYRAVSDLETYKVDTFTVSDIVKKYQIETIKLLKIDCEGSEYQIFKTLSADNLSSIKYLIFELHENLAEVDAEADIEKALAKNNFSFKKRDIGNGCKEYFCINSLFK